MPTGAITEYVNVAQVTLYAFWIFFFALVLWLHRENKREGYPLQSDPKRRIVVQGFPGVPPVKSYKLADGRPEGADALIGDGRGDSREIKLEPTGGWPGAPFEPTGNPLVDGVGPAAWAERQDVPDVTFDGRLRIVPMRADEDYRVVSRDPDPRGLPVIAADGEVAGAVRDVWVDRSEPMIRYLEVEVPTDAGPRNVLVPNMLVKLRRMRRAPAGYENKLHKRLIDSRPYEVVVKSVCAHHFKDAPVTKKPDEVTRLEEDKAMAYFGGGHLFALDRAEPFV
ncbi:MAG: photosynthetic reaction center subunit H [Gammaproteobacteria bacterium]|nr:MAG: photosynthetic reaction center subunit H [Gammaproteobacteria bacterium]